MKSSAFGCNVYVASLPLDFTDQQLFELFAPYGSINSARIMRAKGTRQSKGYGFVLYKEARGAEMAIAALNGMALGGGHLQIRLAHPNASTALRKFARRGSAPSESSNNSSLVQAVAAPMMNQTVVPSTLLVPTGFSPLLDPQVSPLLPSQTAPQTSSATMKNMTPLTLTPISTLCNAPYIPAHTMIAASSAQPVYILVLPEGQQPAAFGY